MTKKLSVKVSYSEINQFKWLVYFFGKKGFVLFNVAQGIKETEMNNYDYIAQLHKKLVTIQVRSCLYLCYG